MVELFIRHRPVPKLQLCGVDPMNNDYNVLIIGAGASGLVCAQAAAARGLRTAVLERNDIPAKKIYATGNGRCNFTNESAKHFQETLGIMSGRFGIEAVMEEGRAYPRSLEASSVAEAMVSAAKRAGAEIFCGAHVLSVQKNGQGFVVECEDGRAFSAPYLVLASGGKAGIQLGCYGEGYKFAKALGHSVIKPIPALDGLVCEEDLSALHGVRVRAKASLLAVREEPGCAAAEALLAEGFGEVQFTKDAVSGICVMDLSRCVRNEYGKRFALSLDLFPELPEAELAQLFMSRKQAFGCGVSWLIPGKLKEYLHTRMPAKAHGPAAMAAAAKDLRFSVKGTRGWKTAQTTCGGVPLSEVDGESFASVLVPGLYITGELLDYDGPCGGFNLDWAIHTGHAAGNSISTRTAE